jgi:serine/threonine-protein kinase
MSARSTPALPSEVRDRLERVLERFEDDWRAGRQPVLEEYLEGSGPERQALLIELVHADLHYRLGRGEAIRVESYLQRYPELMAEPTVVVDLIVAEHALRRQREPGLGVDEYLTRFPHCREGLLQRLAGAADSGPGKHTVPGEEPATQPTPPLPDGTSIPQVPGYEVLEELGRGGMGVVYKARQKLLNRLVALKMILSGSLAGPEERVRFLAEAESIAAVRHPSIVQVFDFGTHAGMPFFSLELCEGGSLANRLAGHPLPPTEAARFVEQIARAVQAAHEKGIIHRDLKPGNTLLTLDGTPKVTDFGLARRVEAGAGMTVTGRVMGTPSYMAPEQAQGRKDIGPAVDIYALGAILYECLTGQPPFRAASPLETVRQVVDQEPVPPRQLNAEVPAGLELVCLKCLHKDPSRRYRSARELADDLARWLEGKPVMARPAGVVQRLVRRGRRIAAVAVLSVVVILVLLGGLAAWSALDRSASRQQDRPKIAVASGTRGPIEEVIRRLLEKRDDHQWDVIAYHENQEALQAYRKGEIDVMMVDDIWVPELVNLGMLCDLREIEAFGQDFGEDGLEAQFDREAVAVCRYPVNSKSVYGLPFLANVQLLMYNHDLVKEYNLRLPRSLTELEEVLAAATSVRKKPAFALRSATGNDLVEVFLQVLYSLDENSVYLDEDLQTVVIRRKEGQQAVDWLFRLQKSGNCVGTSAGLGTEQMKSIFFREDQLMAFGWPGWVTAGYQEEFKRRGVHPAKAISMHLMAGRPVLGVWLLAIKNTSRHQEDAYTLIRDLCRDSEVQAQLWRSGSFPASKRVNGRTVMQAELQTRGRDGRREFYSNGITQVRKGLAVAKARPRTPHWSDIETVIGQRFDDGFFNRAQAPRITELLGGIPWVKIE